VAVLKVSGDAAEPPPPPRRRSRGWRRPPPAPGPPSGLAGGRVCHQVRISTERAHRYARSQLSSSMFRTLDGYHLICLLTVKSLLTHQVVSISFDG
jgi:hypothetical protein